MVLVCVVDTGMPVNVASPMQKHADKHAAKPWYCSIFTMFMPTDLMIFLPPNAVPSDMTADTSKMSQNGNVTLPSTVPDMAIMMPSMHRDKNFCPSCAPCSTATPAPEMICAHLKNALARERCARQQNTRMRRVNSHPVPNPRKVETTRP